MSGRERGRPKPIVGDRMSQMAGFGTEHSDHADPGTVDATAIPLVNGPAGRARLDSRRGGRWPGSMLCLAVLVGAGTLYWSRAHDEPGDRAAFPASACPASDWQTRVTLDQSRPELATTTLRSRNSIGPADAASCVDVSVACLQEGPYFEVRLASSAIGVREVGPLQIRNLKDELSVQLFRPTDGSETAVRIVDKPSVELIAYALANSLGFRVPITFTTGETAVAEFRSYHFLSAVRPVLFACNMRSLQDEKPEEVDD
jgi:hypothetical protein